MSVDCYGMPQAILRALVAQQELVGDVDDSCLTDSTLLLFESTAPSIPIIWEPIM